MIFDEKTEYHDKETELDKIRKTLLHG